MTSIESTVILYSMSSLYLYVNRPFILDRSYTIEKQYLSVFHILTKHLGNVLSTVFRLIKVGLC